MLTALTSDACCSPSFTATCDPSLKRAGSTRPCRPCTASRLVHPGRKGNEVVYTYSDAEMKRVLRDAAKRGVRVKDPVQRYKGLGEMDAKQLRETTMDPAHRLLRRITVNDAEAACEVFDLLMGSDVAPRKEFIVSSADEIDRSRVDA